MGKSFTQWTMKTALISISILCCLVLGSAEEERQLSNLLSNPLGTLLGLGGAGLTWGAVGGLANSNALLAALAGTGINGLTGTGPVVSGLAGAGVSDLLTGDGNGLLNNILGGGKGELTNILSGGKAGGKVGKGPKHGKGKGKGKHVIGKGRMLDRQLSNL